MHIVCSDMEGIYTPEIWIHVAERTGVPELRLTTRDIPDYDVLMKRRLSILREHGIKIGDIQAVISAMEPLPGAREFLDWLRTRTQIIIVSDTYVEFAAPLMEKLGWPTLLCHNLTIGPDGTIEAYNLRQKDGKRMAALALKSLNYRVIGVGDSYNDITMLKEADVGILYRPPENVRREFPGFIVTENYETLKERIGPYL